MKKFFLCITVILLLYSCAKKEAPVSSATEQIAVSAKRACASDEVLQREIAENPARQKFLDELETKTKNFTGRRARLAGTLYVGVVVHVVLTNPALVTNAQVQGQIDVLNKDFGKDNKELSNPNVYLAGYSSGAVADCDIRFYIAQIIRKQTTVTAFSTNDGVKRSNQGGSDAVDAGTKLNMWVCNIGGGILGYAKFPGGNAATDGVVLNYLSFGTKSTGYSLYDEYDLGRTATHEVGHWFNLHHIWGQRTCGTDYVDDTPQQDGPNFGCPPQGLTSQCGNNQLEQWMNYMDYTDDACMYMFSGGQKVRMDAAIDDARAAWVTTSR